MDGICGKFETRRRSLLKKVARVIAPVPGGGTWGGAPLLRLGRAV
jgi:hypothetical protein